MKNKDIKSKSKEELKAQLIELDKELIKFNTQVATGTTLKSPGLVRKTKKTIAKILTQLTSREGADE
ncbi:MAG: 50S ribosomal protein L29 [archaeon]